MRIQKKTLKVSALVLSVLFVGMVALSANVKSGVSSDDDQDTTVTELNHLVALSVSLCSDEDQDTTVAELNNLLALATDDRCGESKCGESKCGSGDDGDDGGDDSGDDDSGSDDQNKCGEGK